MSWKDDATAGGYPAKAGETKARWYLRVKREMDEARVKKLIEGTAHLTPPSSISGE